jgi:hypothetical protein
MNVTCVMTIPTRFHREIIGPTCSDPVFGDVLYKYSDNYTLYNSLHPVGIVFRAYNVNTYSLNIQQLF